MSHRKSATVIFSAGSTKEDFFNEHCRREAVERGVHAILTHVAGVDLVSASHFACTANLAGNADAMKRLTAFVESAKLGSVELDTLEKPAFFAVD